MVRAKWSEQKGHPLLSGTFSTSTTPDYNIPVVAMLFASRNRTAIVNIGVSALNGFIGDHVGHEHCALEIDGIGARRNAPGREFAPLAVITNMVGFSSAGNEMQLPAPVAHDPIPHWHVVIMIRRGLVEGSSRGDTAIKCGLSLSGYLDTRMVAGGCAARR